MKKIILLVLFCVSIGFSLSAQSAHLDFKGIPINGSLSEFVEKLKSQGFKLSDIDDDIATLTGTFVNKPATVYVVASPKTKTVWKVSVNLSKDDNWYSLKSDYKFYKEQYKEKYGSPKKEYEFFSEPYYEGDGYETQALRKEKCHYLSYWETDGGTVYLKISKYTEIGFSYEDSVNTVLRDWEQKSNIQNDI